MATISEALTVALQHHQGGRLQAAEQIYRQIIATEPNQADAIHLLGVLAYQAGKHEIAIETIHRAIAVKKTDATFHCNLGEAYRALRKIPEAAACYRRALELKPDFVQAHNNLGVLLQDQKELAEAAECFRHALQRKPDYAEAHNNLGCVLQEQEKPEEAAACFRRALELNPGYAVAFNNLGNTLRNLGELAEAATCFRRALQRKPDYIEAHNNLGIVLQEQGKAEEAVACYRHALELNPNHPAVHYNLGVVHFDRGKLEEAVACYRRALQLNPEYAEAHNNLGYTLKEQEKLEEAVACFRRALELKPDYAEAHNNLATALEEQGKLEEAIVCYRRAVELKPDYAEAHNNLGLVLHEQGKMGEALACLRRALELKPHYAEVHNNLGLALTNQEKVEEAIASYQRAVELQPDFPLAHNNLGKALKARERYAEAREAFDKARQLSPGWDLLRLSSAAICPAVFECSMAIDEYRAGLLAQVNDLGQGEFKFDIRQLGESAAQPPFNLLYQGRNERPIKEAWARLFRNLPIRETKRSRSARPKLGLVVTQKHELIFLRWCTELLRRIKPDGWEIAVICSLAGAPRVETDLSGCRLQLLPISGTLGRIVETVREARFDVLCHWETGSDPTNYFLPFFRLAPVQCNLAGIQATSGIPQMDYYLSSAYIEPEGADAHYSEKLLRARSLLGYHMRPLLPAVLKPREAFGFDAGQHLYVCPQNLRKFHPDFDPLLAGILRQDPAGVVVIVADRGACVTPMLRRRFAKTLAEVLERVVFLPHQSYADYLCLVSAADVILDPLYYSGGTTTLEALSLGKPIVTWPSRFQIGRGVLASYRKMGIAGFVANDAAEYVRLAVALGTDAEYRQAAGREISGASGELFEDQQAVQEYEQVFTRLVEESRRS